MKNLETMSGPALQRLIDKLDVESHNATKRMIEIGRGMHRFSDIERDAKEGDSEAIAYMKTHARWDAAHTEMQARKRWHGGIKPIRRPH